MVRLCCLLFLGVFSCSSLLSAGQESRASAGASHQIQSILDSISATNVRSYLDTIIGFTFRHTVDDTTSLTTGIGAARRWVYRKFQEFSAASGGRLQPQYFDFTATICGVTSVYRNVMAVLPGTVTPDRYFVVSGHLDTRGDPNSACVRGIFSPGANDDGSGTAASIELARVLSQYQFDASLIFMTVVGEDEGLFGSEAYAAFADANNLQIDGMITNDVVGNIIGSNGITDSTSVRHFSSVADATPHRQMSRYMKLKSEFYYPVMTVNLIPAVDRPGRGGDHQSFQNHGFTAVRFVEPNENLVNQHTSTDIVANMSPAYTARVARVNAVGLVSLAWAPERPSPPAVLDLGTGTSVVVQWTSSPENDLAGYRVAVRDSGGLFYSQIVDAGNALSDTITGLTPGISVYISRSSYDTAGNESMFSSEMLVRPTVIPPAPTQFSSTSFGNVVTFAWAPSPPLDVVRYRVYRSLVRTSGFALYDSVAAPGTSYADLNMLPHTLYHYLVRAVDATGNESASSVTVGGQHSTHDLGVLVVDGTKDGPGTAIAPTDSSVDAYYQTMLADFALAGEWDVADSLLQAYRITDAEMGPYSAVVWHSDVRASAPIFADTSGLRKYVQQGGRLVFSGWKLSSSFKSGATTGANAYPAGSFVPAMLKVDSTTTNGPISQDFITAVTAAAGYNSVTVDSQKIGLYGGTLVNTDAVLLPYAGSAQTLYVHHGKNPGSPFEGKPVAWKYVGTDYRLVVFDFPLYYMRQNEAMPALRQVLLDLGEPTVGVEEGARSVPMEFVLEQNYPNPFNPTTHFGFRIVEFGFVSLKLFDVLGREVATLVNEKKPPGSYEVPFDARGLSSGVYFYRLNAGKFVETRKLVLLK